MSIKNVSKRGHKDSPWGSKFLHQKWYEQGANDCNRSLAYAERGGYEDIVKFFKGKLKSELIYNNIF